MKSHGAVKKLIVLGVLFVMAFSLFACTKDYEYKEGDFSLTIEVDKTEVQVGDTVTVTATFKNLSGRDIPIRISPWKTSIKAQVEDLIYIELYDENGNYRVAEPDLGGTYGKRTIKKGAVIQYTEQFIVEGDSDRWAYAGISFYTRKELKAIGASSEVIKIIVKE